jgi:hypothetical protein
MLQCCLVDEKLDFLPNTQFHFHPMQNYGNLTQEQAKSLLVAAQANALRMQTDLNR